MDVIIPVEIIAEILKFDPKLYGIGCVLSRGVAKLLNNVDPYKIFKNAVVKYSGSGAVLLKCEAVGMKIGVYKHGREFGWIPLQGEYIKVVYIWSYGNFVRTLYYKPGENGRLFACLTKQEPYQISYLRKNGKTKYTIQLKDAYDILQHGVSVFYRKNGKLKRRLIFNKGVLQSMEEYDKAGYWTTTVNYKNKLSDIGINVFTFKQSNVEFNT
ncbi:hypothetical protein E24_00013 [Faustovirus]|nr:hypothetical protein PRJ_Fausto_00013 [Faustovirus]AMN82949.1 hypothetical protein E24_00013 [Faustovirus]AMN83936.1 hypothetical protein D5a_00013 [Faustovirus]AMN84921.1 hypothetical protein E23_00013 [Faustovirus]QBR98906.1 hypothetical protein [Faustovirus mariensis]